MQVWGFDASKQMVGAGFAHVANLLIAILLYQHQVDAEQVMKGVDQVRKELLSETIGFLHSRTLITTHE